MAVYSSASSVSSGGSFHTALGALDGSSKKEVQYSCKSFTDLPEDLVQLTEALQKLDAGNLYGMATWALPRFSTSEFGKEEHTIFTRFFEGFQKVYKDSLEPGQQEQWEISYATHLGTKGLHEKPFKELSSAFNQQLQVFLGDSEKIKSVSTIEKAQDVAFALFGGVRNVESSSSEHLARIVQVASNADCSLIQLVMHQLRKEQEAYFTQVGFLGRVTFAIVPDEAKAKEEGKEVDVAIAGGSRSIQAYLKGETDGRFLFGSDQPGLVIHRGKDRGALQSEAISLAKRQYDAPVVYKTKVAEKYIFQDAKGLHKIFIEHVKKLDLPEIDLVDMQVDLLPLENLQKLYPDASGSQRKRLEKLLFGKDDPLPPVKEEGTLTWKRVLQVAGVILGSLLFYKYVVRPLLLKSQENGNPSSQVGAS